MYWDIRSTVAPGWDGSRVVGLSHVLDYQKVFGVQLSGWEVDVVLMLDRVYRGVMQ